MVKYLKNPIFISTIICIFFFYTGLFNFKNEQSNIFLIKPENIVKIQGYIINSPVKTSSEKYYSCKFKLISVQSKENIKSEAKGNLTVLIPAVLVEAYFPGKLYTSSTSNGYLYESGGCYCFEGFWSDNCFIAKSTENAFWENTFFAKIDQFRALCRLQFKRLMFLWKSGGGLLLALLCGAREYTDNATKEAFKNAGLSHILALSGMHLSMFSNLSNKIGKTIGSKKLTYFLRCLTVILFVWFAGLSPSLLRAFICNFLLLFAAIFATDKPDMIIILCFSFLIQSIINPVDIYNVGFILSYSALFGILIFNKFYTKIIQIVLPNFITSSLATSLSAQMFTAPISLTVFKSFSPIGIIATSIISPFITLFIYSGLVLIIFSLIFPIFAPYSAIFINFIYNIINKLVILFSRVPRINI